MTTTALDFDRSLFNPTQLALERMRERAELPVYVYADDVVLAVNLARATRRPLFVRGQPGTGKSCLAASVAALLGWRTLQQVVSSRTGAQDLLWHFDAVRRLSDAQLRERDLPPRSDYVFPRAFWHAADPLSAMQFPTGVDRSGATPPPTGPCVLLIDEMDKAEPDVPNDLLELLDKSRFVVDDLDPPLTVQGERSQLLIVITSNGERDMPAAFLRRCVVLELPDPDADWLVRVADEHFPADTDDGLHRRIAELTSAVARSREQGGRRPGTAEYLDAVVACRRLEIHPDTNPDAWQRVETVLLRKSTAIAAKAL